MQVKKLAPGCGGGENISLFRLCPCRWLVLRLTLTTPRGGFFEIPRSFGWGNPCWYQQDSRNFGNFLGSEYLKTAKSRKWSCGTVTQANARSGEASLVPVTPFLPFPKSGRPQNSEGVSKPKRNTLQTRPNTREPFSPLFVAAVSGNNHTPQTKTTQFTPQKSLKKQQNSPPSPSDTPDKRTFFPLK